MLHLAAHSEVSAYELQMTFIPFSLETSVSSTIKKVARNRDVSQ